MPAILDQSVIDSLEALMEVRQAIKDLRNSEFDDDEQVSFRVSSERRSCLITSAHGLRPCTVYAALKEMERSLLSSLSMKDVEVSASVGAV